VRFAEANWYSKGLRHSRQASNCAGNRPLTMSNPPPNQPPAEREVPRQVRFFTNGFVFRKLTIKERLLVLIGYNLAMECHIATEHRPGRTQSLVTVSVTPCETGEAAMLSAKHGAIAEQRKRDQAMKEELEKRKFTPPPVKPFTSEKP
jgi:hypothetical protein